MGRRWLLAVAMSCLGVEATAQAQAPDPLPLALVVTHADGRVTEAAVSTRLRRSWTPYLPRVPEWQDPPGVLPIRALDTRAVRDGDVVRVTISVLRGAAMEVVEPVAAVALRLQESAVVDELRRVGLMPITLAVTPFAAPPLHAPEPSSSVDGIVVEGVEPLSHPVPAYRVTVRNLTDTAAVTLAVETFSQGRRGLRGQQGNPSAEPVVAAGGTFTFMLRPSGGGGGQTYASAVPLDAVRITGAIWADGRRTGDPERLRDMVAVHAGRLAALDEIVGVVREAAARSASDPVGEARRVATAVAAIPTTPNALAIADAVRGAVDLDGEAFSRAMAAGSVDVRRRLTDDLDRVVNRMAPDEARQWLAEALAAIEAWQQRLRPIVRPR